MIIRNNTFQCSIKMCIQLFQLRSKQKILQYKCYKTMQIVVLWNVNKNYEKNSGKK